MLSNANANQCWTNESDANAKEHKGSQRKKLFAGTFMTKVSPRAAAIMLGAKKWLILWQKL